MTVIPEFGRLTQGNCNFEASLDWKVRPCLRITKEQQRRRGIEEEEKREKKKNKKEWERKKMITNKETRSHDIHKRTKVCVNIYSYYVYFHMHNHMYETSVSVMFSLETQKEGWVNCWSWEWMKQTTVWRLR